MSRDTRHAEVTLTDVVTGASIAGAAAALGGLAIAQWLADGSCLVWMAAAALLGAAAVPAGPPYLRWRAARRAQRRQR